MINTERVHRQMPARKAEKAAEDNSLPGMDVSTIPGMEAFKNVSYEDMIRAMENQLDVIPGSSLIEDKDELEGIPFIITRIVFRPSGDAAQQYVSVEIKSRDHGNAVFNDGSTGVRSQLLSYCLAKGWAVPLEGRGKNYETATGLAKVAMEDLDWIGDNVEVRFTDSGDMVTVIEMIPGLWAPRGLRASRDYEVDVNGKKIKATTYYLG